MKNRTQREKDMAATIAIKNIFTIAQRGGLDVRYNDDEDVVSVTVGEIEAAIIEAFRLGTAWEDIKAITGTK